MDLVSSLCMVRNTLECISVEGIDNMDKMVGAAKMLDRVINAMESIQTSEDSEKGG